MCEGVAEVVNNVAAGERGKERHRKKRTVGERGNHTCEMKEEE